MFDISVEISSMSFWDDVASWAGVFAGVSAILAIVVDIPGWVSSERTKLLVKIGCAFVLIAGVGGQISATSMVTAKNALIVAYLNGQTALANKGAATANKIASETRERAVELERQVELLKGKNLELTQEVLRLGGRIDGVGDTVSSIDKRTRAREVTESQSTSVRYGINGRQRTIIIVRLNDAEPNAYAQAIIKLLKTAHFSVVEEVLRDKPSETGVIVCENSKSDQSLYRVLKDAKIATQFVELRSKGRPSFCGGANLGSFPPVPSEAGSLTPLTQRATRIFVGEHAPIR